MIKEINKSYAAGVIDSDGCIRICKEGRSHNRERSTTYYPMVFVSQTDGRAIDLLMKIWGGSISKVKSNGKLGYIQKWSITWKKARNFLKDIKPYLKIKKRQAELALALENGSHNSGRKADGTMKKLSDTELKRREKLFIKISEEKTNYYQSINIKEQ